jgi:hypothetical protein
MVDEHLYCRMAKLFQRCASWSVIKLSKRRGENFAVLSKDGERGIVMKEVKCVGLSILWKKFIQIYLAGTKICTSFSGTICQDV